MTLTDEAASYAMDRESDPQQLAADVAMLRDALAPLIDIVADRCSGLSAEDWAALEDARQAIAQAVEVPARPDAWVPVAERMPASGVVVLACYRNALGNWRRIRVCWTAAKTVEAGSDSDFCEYDESTDTYYDPEGWYEQINNWDMYSAAAVHEGEVTHWMPLPPPPQR